MSLLSQTQKKTGCSWHRLHFTDGDHTLPKSIRNRPLAFPHTTRNPRWNGLFHLVNHRLLNDGYPPFGHQRFLENGPPFACMHSGIVDYAPHRLPKGASRSFSVRRWESSLLQRETRAKKRRLWGVGGVGGCTLSVWSAGARGGGFFLLTRSSRTRFFWGMRWCVTALVWAFFSIFPYLSNICIEVCVFLRRWFFPRISYIARSHHRKQVAIYTHECDFGGRS